ncbi:TLC domain-containing protein [Kluyveromyces lactis]|uniref:KLLA0B13497p n=1 Tax=Kluyveromyces lactis (strain ATCC 8585 / CBS 2359 / DSM 70799 / NBRC 1267 / NRRL Y-1140 / WM37) TaxID=284590 RepID=Q6CVA7_KLULA|nr:uncharacterized protein KLLA0_B13497g [Kluyveromyces lactis]CAH02525.1 KLLA0B13497p [Kluyveromyces lactis]|eukprot:XP_452132.1 uncharacterized protein KLLA0_B13497g [Kluyveromyces lactis]
MPPKNQSPELRRRRTTSIGRINLGDTSVPSLSTMSVTEESKHASEARLKLLSSSSEKDIDVLRKLWLSYRELSYRHSWLTSLLIISVIYLFYICSGNRTASNPLHMFVAISYQIGDTNMYGKGPKDLCFVFFYMIFFTFLREFIMQVILRPLSIKMGSTRENKIRRMMEQMYSIFYYSISGPFGLYIMYHTDLWLFRTDTMYKTYPDFNNEYLYKIFYLGQAAFWTQQSCVLTLQLEKPRKDFQELIFHHIVTLALIWLSYVFHFTKMGLSVYVTMDVSDFFLSLSKTFNYLDSSLTPPFFLFFIVSWVYLRHYINLKILWSLLTEFTTVGNYTLNFATQQYKCWISQPIIFVLLFALHLLNLFWLFFIARILYRLVVHGIQKDERSDSESESENEPEKESAVDEKKQ